MPLEGVPKPPGSRVSDHLKQAGESVGIDFTGLCDRYPNTLQSHALIDYTFHAHGEVKQNEVVEALFKAYFTDGVYLDTANLIKIAEQCGLPTQDVLEYINCPSNIGRQQSRAYDFSIEANGSVPFFIMNYKGTFSGAQDVDAFVHMFDTIASTSNANL